MSLSPYAPLDLDVLIDRVTPVLRFYELRNFFAVVAVVLAGYEWCKYSCCPFQDALHQSISLVISLDSEV